MLQEPKLKEARYKCFGYGWSPEISKYNKVEYVIINDRCYFSGIEKEKRTSTINAAEGVIKAISEQESIPIARLRWFDLIAYKGYRQRPGEYDLKELKIGPGKNLTSTGRTATSFEVNGEEAILFVEATEDFIVTSWRHSVPCPMEVLEIFRDHIGADFYSKSIDVLKIPAQISISLQNAGIKTVVELICIEWPDLRKILVDSEIIKIMNVLSEYRLHIEDGLCQKEIINKLSGGIVCR